MDKGVKVNIVERKAKDKKGTYISIKIGDKKTQYYKFDEKVPVDALVQYYKDRYVSKRLHGTLKDYIKAFSGKGRIKDKKRRQVLRTKATRSMKKSYPRKQDKAKKYVQLIRRRGFTEDSIKMGVSRIIIPDLLNVESFKINQAYKKLLRPLVYDNDLLNILATEENMQKLGIRLEHSIIVKDSKQTSQEIVKLNIVGKTTRQVIEIIKEAGIRKGKSWRGRTGDKANSMIQYLKERGFSIASKSEGIIGKLETTLIFRKNK